MEYFIPISSLDYYGVDGYYYKAVVVKNSKDSTAEELYDQFVHKQVKIGNAILEVDRIEYEQYDRDNHRVLQIKKNEPLVLIIRNKQWPISFKARLHPKMWRSLKKYRHDSASLVKMLIYGVIVVGIIAFVLGFVLV